jgi:hypothetical protein
VAKKIKKIDDLNALADAFETSTKEILAEQRSNSMLVAGNHYSSRNAESWSRLRDLRSIPIEQRVRLTKNHIQKVTKTHVNNLTSNSPASKVTPRDEKSIQSRKAAELNDSVWQYAYDTLEMQLKTISFAQDYIELGECATKVFWNPYYGKVVAYNQKMDDQGSPMTDEQGQPVPDEKSPQYEGRLEIEVLVPTNIGVDPNCSRFADAAWVLIRKMIPTDKAKELVGNDPDKLKFISDTKKDQTMLFDPAVSDYTTGKDMTMIREFYFRPCAEYPQGYYFITTKEGILFEGELPFGIFPIEYEGFDRIAGSPRHRSIIKQLRPYQIEINRTASKIAEHQITSDDKILLQYGTKLSTGVNLAGIRTIQFSGAKPEILEGRSGAQYVEYMLGQIQEMYQVGMIQEDSELLDQKGADPMGLLFRSVKAQKRFSTYAEKFEHFLKRVCKLYLKLAKEYLDETMLIPMVGKSEAVNIAEFKNTNDLDTVIKVVPMVDDINTMWGKWLSINHMIQFGANQLDKETIGQLAKNLPFGNFKEIFADATLDYDTVSNFMLAVERGEQPQPSPSDNKPYMVKKLEARTRQSDFAILPQEVKQYYFQVIDQYNQMIAQEQDEIRRAEQGFIPTTGPLVRTDLKAEVPNASGGMKTVSKSYPIDALAWLDKQLQAQGTSVENLAELSQASQAQIAGKLNQMPIQSGQTLTPTAGQPSQQQQVPNQ